MDSTVGEIKEATRTFYAVVNAAECGDVDRKFAKYAQSELWLVHAIVRKYTRGTAAETISLYRALLDRARQRCGRRSGILEGDIDAHSVSATGTMKKMGAAWVCLLGVLPAMVDAATQVVAHWLLVDRQQPTVMHPSPRTRECALPLAATLRLIDIQIRLGI
eukprot:4899820-Amphidinium_carterae.1